MSKTQRAFTARFCYDAVTPESAECGDFADHGFYIPGSGQFSVMDLSHEDHIRTGEECTLTDWTLREVIEAARDLGIQSRQDASWFYSYPAIEDCGTGAEISYSLHIDGVTPSTYGRIARLLHD